MNTIIVFGAGKIGKLFVDECIKNKIMNIRLTDNNPQLWEKTYKNFRIEDPKSILTIEPDLVIIAVGKNHEKEIKAQLKDDFMIPDDKIASWKEEVFVIGNETYNCGDMKLNYTQNDSILVRERDIYKYLDNTAKNDLSKFFFEKEHKGMTKWLHYFEAYNRFFSRYRGKDVTILEIGVFKGGSLQMWKDYFTFADNKVQIYGIDILPECKNLQEDNIRIFIGSQEDREFLRKVKSEIGKVDILIDDGGHTMSQQLISFEELFDLVADDGIYLCEDLHTSYMESYGGGYKGETFLEHSKDLIDFLHAQYLETDNLRNSVYSEKIKFITYCDSMVFIEKKSRTTKSMSLFI